MPIVLSKSDFNAPALIAIAIPWIISAESGPIIWAPITFWVFSLTTSFIRVLSRFPDIVFFKALNSLLYALAFIPFYLASSKLRPTTAMDGWLKTALGTFS